MPTGTPQSLIGHLEQLAQAFGPRDSIQHSLPTRHAFSGRGLPELALSNFHIRARLLLNHPPTILTPLYRFSNPLVDSGKTIS
jgi:hypothetical protein